MDYGRLLQPYSAGAVHARAYLTCGLVYLSLLARFARFLFSLTRYQLSHAFSSEVNGVADHSCPTPRRPLLLFSTLSVDL